MRLPTLVCLPLLVIAFVILPVLANNDTIYVSEPKLRPGQTSPMTARETPFVWVNVTSTYPVASVTLYHTVVHGDINPPMDIERYDRTPMRQVLGNQSEATYEATMQHVENNTWVWGFAMAVDSRGNQPARPDPVRIYFELTPDPDASSISFFLMVRHIDPRTMLMDLTLSVTLWNYYSYSPVWLWPQPPSLPSVGSIPVNRQESKFIFTYQGDMTLFYADSAQGMFPFDSYVYLFAFDIPDYVAQRVSMNGDRISANVVYVDYTARLFPRDLSEVADNSIWRIRSETQLLLPDGLSVARPYLRASYYVERAPETVMARLLIPGISLYTLLGISVLLTGENELRNRLLLYLNVFVFSQSFMVGMRSLPFVPTMAVPSVMEQLVLAVIPCATIYAVFSVIESIVGHEKYLDVFSTVISASWVFFVAEAAMVLPTPGLWRFSLYILMVLLALFSGLIFVVVRSAWRRWRERVRARKFNEAMMDCRNPVWVILAKAIGYRIVCAQHGTTSTNTRSGGRHMVRTHRSDNERLSASPPH